MYLAYNAPHTPLQAPEEEIRPFAETGKFNRGVSTLYGMLHRMDAGISRIFETLRDHGLENWFTEIERERATIYDRPLCLPRGLA